MGNKILVVEDNPDNMKLVTPHQCIWPSMVARPY